ncbi:MAG: O-antigen ligase family protein [Pirellulales bacterium]|nr:O-antigen ligase family protein [Pirellulales bacterium]
MKPSPKPQPPLAGLLLACATALVVARPLVPSEMSAARGGGQLFVVSWLLLGTVWAACLALGRVGAVRLRLIDLLVLALFGIQAAVAVACAAEGATRPALNLAGEQIALALSYFLLRQLIPSMSTARALLAAMIALAVAEAALGLYQYAVTMPATRAAYRAQPELSLREAGIDAPPGSAQRALFEQRLASTEPLARFELTNSLAGLLLVWLVVLAAARADVPAVSFVARWGPWLVGLPLGVVLLLTKSRSALVAWAVVLGVLALRRFAHRGWISWPRVLLAVVVLTAAVAGALATGGLDREVLTEAPKSLGYRLQYWQATGQMIRQSPWWGVGYGNFADQYTRFKLPEASEEIADPHNFVLETWANSGMFAGVLLAVVLVGFFRSGVQPSSVPTKPSGNDQLEHWIAAGAVAAPIVALAASILIGVPLTAIDLLLVYLAGGGAWLLLIGWRRSMAPLGGAMLYGAAALLINLLAAGGIGFPSVAGSLWLLVALTVAIAPPASAAAAVQPLRAAVAAVCLLAAMLLVYSGSFLPVIACQARLESVSAMPNPPDEQRALLLEAAAADPLAPEPWSNLAQLELESARQDPERPGDLESFREATAAWLAHASPASSAAWLHAGDLYLAAFHLQGKPVDLDAAVQAYRRAVETYPHHAVRRAKLALALAEAKYPQSAAEAQQAWRLDQLTPHADQKLPEELRAALERQGWPEPRAN